MIIVDTQGLIGLGFFAGQDAVWGVNDNDDIFKWTGSGWQQMPGKLKQVSSGQDSVWGVDATNRIWRWSPH